MTKENLNTNWEKCVKLGITLWKGVLKTYGILMSVMTFSKKALLLVIFRQI